MDIMRKASYGACDKLALRWSRATRTLLPPGHNVLHSPIKIARVHNLIVRHMTY